MKVLITGATGFIGNHVARMCLEQGDDVRVMVMPGEDRSPLNGMDVEFVEGNLLDLSSLRKCVEGVEGLYHLARLGDRPVAFHVMRERGHDRLDRGDMFHLATPTCLRMIGRVSDRRST